MPVTASVPHCIHCLLARSIVAQLYTGDPPHAHRDGVLANVSDLLYGAMSNLLSEYDYQNNQHTNMAMGVRMVALAAQQLSEVDKGAARVRQAHLKRTGGG